MAIPTEQELIDAKQDLDDLAEMVNGDSTTTVTTRTGGDKPTVSKALADALGSNYVEKSPAGNAVQEIDAGVRAQYFDIADASAATGYRLFRFAKTARGVAFQQMSDDASEAIGTIVWMGAGGLNANMGGGKVLSRHTIDHAGGVVQCTETPYLMAGIGLYDIQRSQAGFYSAKLTVPVKNQFKCGVTFSTAVGFFANQYTVCGQLTSANEIAWNVRHAAGSSTDFVDGIRVSIAIKDYS